MITASRFVLRHPNSEATQSYASPGRLAKINPFLRRFSTERQPADGCPIVERERGQARAVRCHSQGRDPSFWRCIAGDCHSASVDLAERLQHDSNFTSATPLHTTDRTSCYLATLGRTTSPARRSDHRASCAFEFGCSSSPNLLQSAIQIDLCAPLKISSFVALASGVLTQVIEMSCRPACYLSIIV
jgi:hypothetical protein